MMKVTLGNRPAIRTASNVLVVLLVIVGVGNALKKIWWPSVPACSSDEVTDTLKRIMRGEQEDVFENLEVSAIRTVGPYGARGQQCRAEIAYKTRLERGDILTFSGALMAAKLGSSGRENIIYTVELTDKGDQFYVQIQDQ